MNDHPTREEVLKSIEPKSDQLNADDLVAGPRTVSITGVKRGDREQPIVVELDGHRPYKPCKSMRRVLIATFSDDPAKWVGQQMTLYCDPEVMWAGVRVGGIRISHLSGLSEPRSYMITQSRSKRNAVVIQPLATLSPEHQALRDEAIGKIGAADSLEALALVGSTIAACPKPVQESVRPIYAQRLADLKAVPAPDANCNLDQWAAMIEPLKTIDHTKEFRETLLPDCPESIRQEVDLLLAARETAIVEGV